MALTEFDRLLEFYDRATDVYNPSGMFQAHKMGDLWGVPIRSRTTINNLASVIQSMAVSCGTISLREGKRDLGYVQKVYIITQKSLEAEPIRIDSIDYERDIVQTPINPRYVWGYFKHPQAALFLVDHGRAPRIYQITRMGSEIDMDVMTRNRIVNDVAAVYRKKHS